MDILIFYYLCSNIQKYIQYGYHKDYRGEDSSMGKELFFSIFKAAEIMKKKIYFAGAIRGGRNFADLYRKMIEHMLLTDIVLTEHIGQADINLKEKGRMSDAGIYNQDTAWLQESDMVVAECSNPSLGVGYELAYAESRGIPCYIFYDKSKTQLSAMLTGNPYFVIYPYQTEEELFSLMDKILS